MRKKNLVLPIFLAASAPAVVLADEAPLRGGDEVSGEEKLEVGAAPVEKVSREQASDDSKAKKKKKKRAKRDDDDEDDDEDDEDKNKDDDDEDRAKGDDDDGDDEEEEKPAPTKRGKPRLHIEGNYENIELRRVEGTVSVYTSRGSGYGVITSSVCMMPCDEVVDGRKGAQFFFAAPWMVASSPFSLGNQKGDIVAHVKGGSAGMRLGGYMLTAFGGSGVILGATALAVGAGSSYRSGIFSPTFGWTTLGIGAGMLAGGIVMIVTSGTSFEIVPRTQEDAGIRFEGGRILF